MRRALGLLALSLLTATAEAAVTGRVMDADGKPLAGVRVRAFAPETQLARSARLASKTPQRDPVATFETKSDGAFTIDTKGNGVVTLIADAPDREWRSLEAVDGEDAGAFVLRSAKKARGRVTAAGKPVANATIIFGGEIVVQSGEDGTYEIAPMGDQEVAQFLVFHPDYVPAAGADGRRDPKRYDIALRPGIALTGRVLAPDGKTPVAGATIRANYWPLATSGEDGSFRIAHAPDVRAQGSSLSAIHGQRIAIAPLERKKTSYDLVLRAGASVSGVVRNVKDGTPVAGATVRVEPWSAITDAKGNYAIAPLPATTSTAWVSHPAYTLPSSPPVDLAEGARVTQNLDLTPLARIRGTVIDEQRRPVAGARVSTTLRPTAVSTGPDGAFVLRVLQPFDTVSVVASKAGFGTASEGPIAIKLGETKTVQVTLRKGFRFDIALVDGEGKPLANEPLMVARLTDSRDARSMIPIPCSEGDTVVCALTDDAGRRTYEMLDGKYHIIAGGTVTVRRTLPDVTIDARTAPMTIRLERGLTIAGRVVDADDQPVENATIQMSGRPGFPRTDAGGGFSIANLEAGVPVTLTAQTSSGLASEPTTLTAPAPDVVLRLPRPARIEGKVYDRESKQPVRDFSIAVLRDRDRRFGPGMPRKFTPDDGRFVLDEVSPGEVDLAVQAKGYAPGSIVDLKTTAGGTTSVDVALDRGAILKGRVTSAGQPLPDVLVNVTSQGPPTRGVRPRPSIHSDSSGEYTVDGIPSGTQRVEFRKPGYVTVTKAFDLTSGEETRGDVELSRGRTLQGRVVDEGGRPVPNAEVSIRGGAMSGPPARTDADGAFSAEGLGGETANVIARKDGYTNAEQEVNLAQTSSITLTLRRGASLNGRVIGVSDSDLQQIEVSAYSERMWRTTAHPDASGNFVIQGVPDGRIFVSAAQRQPTPRQSERKTVDVLNGVAPFVQIDFTSGIAVRGRVTRNGVPVEGSVTFSTARTQGVPASRPFLSASGTIGPAGMYEVRLSEPGEYEVRVNMIGSSRFDPLHKVNVTSSMTHDIDVKGGTLRGRVVDERTGAPVGSAIVELRTQRQGGPATTADSDGRFSFDALGDDTYQLSARRDRNVSETMEVVVSNGFAPEMEVRLRQTISIGLRVLDANGNVLEPNVRLVPKAGSGAGEVVPVTRGDNGHRMWALPGSYRAMVYASGFLMTPVDLVVPGPDVEVRMERAGSVMVKGTIPGAAMVRLKGANRTFGVQVGGSMGGIPPGTYRLEVLDAQQQVIETRENIVVKGGETTTITLP